MKKKSNENMKEEKNGIRKECQNCPENQDCPFATEDDFLTGNTAKAEAPEYEEQDSSLDEEDDNEGYCLFLGREIHELDEAVGDMMNCFINLIAKAAKAQLYLDRLEEWTTHAMKGLYNIVYPEDSQEE